MRWCICPTTVTQHGIEILEKNRIVSYSIYPDLTMIFAWIQSFVGVLRRACIGTNWCTWVGRVAPKDPCVRSRRAHHHHCAFYLSVDRYTTSRYGKHYFRQENMIGESKANRWCPVVNPLQKYRLYFSTYIYTIKIFSMSL